MRNIFLSFLILISTSLFALTTIDNFTYDENAVLNYSGKSFEYQGFDISILNNPNFPYLYFNNKETGLNMATYNWAFQYWVTKNRAFDSSKIDLQGLYRVIALENSVLNRNKPQRSTQNKLKQQKVASLTVTTDQQPQSTQNHSVPDGYNKDLRYDKNAVVNYNIKSLGGYEISIEKRGNPFVLVYDREKPWWNIAVYNYERQYWVWTLNNFDYSEVDISSIYSKIDLSKTDPNRLKPDILSIWGYMDKEKELYDYTNDKEFSDFIDYLEFYNIPREDIDKFLHSANNPGKRGAALPIGHYYEESETGFQVLQVLPNVDTPEEARQVKTSERFAVGGMELYFKLHNSEMITSVTGASKYFRDMVKENNSVNMTIVEIIPPDGTYTDKITGTDFYKEVEKFHEDKFRINFDIDVKKVTLDYDLLKAKPGEDEQILMDRIFDKYIHDRFGYDKFYMYYFTDSKKFAEVDYKLTHPRIYGAYVSDWENKKDIYLHELGHTLNLYHHFNLTKNASIPEAHIYTPCRMNYRSSFVSEDFCPLCSYSLGISPVIGDFQSGNEQESQSVETPNLITERFIKDIDGKTVLFSKYSSGTVAENGSYNFGSLTVHELQWDRDLIALHYSYPGGNGYLGVFTPQLKFISEYNMGKLDIKYFRVNDNRIFAVYTNSADNQYIGIFDNNMKFVNEIMIDKTDLDFFTIDNNKINYRYEGTTDNEVIDVSVILNN